MVALLAVFCALAGPYCSPSRSVTEVTAGTGWLYRVLRSVPEERLDLAQDASPGLDLMGRLVP